MGKRGSGAARLGALTVGRWGAQIGMGRMGCLFVRDATVPGCIVWGHTLDAWRPYGWGCISLYPPAPTCPRLSLSARAQRDQE